STASPPLTLDLERRLRAVKPLKPPKADRTHTLNLTGEMAGYVWSINNVAWTKDVPPLPIAAGERVELIFVNQTPMQHPMHLHGHEFQVVEIDGKRFAGAVRDTVLVPPGAGSSSPSMPTTPGFGQSIAICCTTSTPGCSRPCATSDGAKPLCNQGGTRESNFSSRCPSALQRGLQPRSPRQRCFGLGDKSAHDVADREDIIDASRGLACREQTRVWTACLGRGDDLIPQASAIATRRLALSTPLIHKSRAEGAQHRLETNRARKRADVVENVDLDRILRVSCGYRLLPLIRSGSFRRGDEPRAEIDPDRAQHQRRRDATAVEDAPGGDDS